MLYLLGSNGRIGKNISKFFDFKGLNFIKVTRKKYNNSLCFDEFIDIVTEDNIIINAATMNEIDLDLFIKNVPPSNKVIHISSVAVYGNTNYSNIPNPINNYGKFKLNEENLLLSKFKSCVIRLANIYGGDPETSGVLELIEKEKFKYIEVDENNDELIRDYVHIELLLNYLIENLNFKKSHTVNISSGTGITLSEFLTVNNLKTTNSIRKTYNKKETIKTSIIDPQFKKFKI